MGNPGRKPPGLLLRSPLQVGDSVGMGLDQVSESHFKGEVRAQNKG